ncbi:ATP-dependent RNA helicase DEAH13 isoform X2 [Malania oleifera]|uniref:ATP-dependent RNA helicase DEAH13 isoform X2 n=1 Tax=Malania oleifera TaxID=397392 RepID=UPI0025ADF5D8|nr:ATP-dependent RNA helicase DEAH13 isoform X2 [Malania oleifera]XP_057964272.1 ATP-dependent RNA helicase DEAH13 isoform X2 [Malania oleifera]XP_057964273.1 ATP-dependent RNA helicase DEAH13 isoform X2 [Malania oleifera]XP_057964274.1 ATP-dependent RNA helicase DEAH13 isoform X2 [Malania oleifera]XP_057964275.1 ATP-dependent RNA helicase DEAH13 isoform X2 [Malania oleifera]
MKSSLENLGQFVDLRRQDSGSLQGGDSNAIILPEKKKNKQKGAKQKCMVKAKTISKISNSRTRKMRELEVCRKRALLLKKSIENLEKYKIAEDAYLLLQSSKDIGQDETVRRRRRKAIQYHKAGLEVPRSDQSFKRKGGNNASCKTDPNFDENQGEQGFDDVEVVQPIMVEREILSNSSISSASIPQQISSITHDTTLPAEEVSIFSSNIVIKEEIRSSLSCSCNYDDRKCIESTGGADNSRKEDFSSTSKLQDCPLQRALTAPIVGDSRKEDFSSTSKLQDCPLQRALTAPIVVHVSRPNEVDNKRKDLPIVMMEQEIMEAINEHSTIVICGETGCGKTTQVPQFLYEAGYGSNQSIFRSGIIGVTQPRRVAVLATARRVAFELGLHLGREIGFQVRHEKKIGDNCSIKFMTDGILLRELQGDILLKRYSIIILDEAHERSLNTDILIGMLSRIIKLRQDEFEKQQKMLLEGKISPECMISPLKVVLMSATLRVEDFVSGRRLFAFSPPVLEVPTRQFPVTTHFSKRTEIVDYIGQAYKKVLSIHKRLPAGGILVFVTGQREVEYLCQKLRKASRELILRSSRGNIGHEVTAVSEMNSIGEINAKEVNEAFDIHGNSDQWHTDRFSSFDEDHDDLNEDESDASYDLDTDSELEIGDDGDSMNDKSPSSDGKLVDVLGEDGSIASLKAAFEALAGKATLNPNSKGEQANHASSDGCLDKFNPGLGEEKRGENVLSPGPLCVLPLYAMLPAAAQLRVFEEIKEGERLVVVATNVAETSLTIPGIKYVVDTGREKVKNYNSSNGMEAYKIQWISKASAAQRAGRAGRTAPGHCYRLYSSAVFNNIFPDFSIAEISKIPVDGVVLLMKSMGIDKVANFPFPTPPQATALVEAESCLKTLEALDSNGKLTPLGKAMALYPMSPRHSRMLLTVIQIMRKLKVYARAGLVLAYAVAAAAALSFSNPFIMQFEGSQSNEDGLQQDGKSNTLDSEKIVDRQEKLRKKKLKETTKKSRAKFSNPTSDALTVAYALNCFELSNSPVEFCNEHALHLKNMEEMSKLRKQLLHLVFSHNIGRGLQQEFSWTHGTMEDVEHAWRGCSDKHSLLLIEEELLSQAICAGWADRIAKRTRGISGLSEGNRKAKAVRYQACMVKETVFLHHWSSLSNSAPEFLVYNELLCTKRPYMHGATSVKSDWLVKYAGSSCSFSAPLSDPKPYYEPLTDQVFCWVIPTFGLHLWQLPLHSLPITSKVNRVAVFAYALLEGNVLPCLGSVRKFMLAPPGSILRPEALGQRRVGNLLNKLNVRTIDSCAMLKEAWEKNPMELHSEILDWFQESFYSQFEELWSQMHGEVVLEPQERFPKRVKREKKNRKLLR